MSRKNFFKIQSSLQKKSIASALVVTLAASMVNCSYAGAMEENEQLHQFDHDEENIQDDKRKLSERFPDLKLGHIDNIDNIRGDFSKFSCDILKSEDDSLKDFLLEIDEKYDDISKEFPKTNYELLAMAYDSSFIGGLQWKAETIKNLGEDKLPKREELIFGIFVYSKIFFKTYSFEELFVLLKDDKSFVFKGTLKYFIEIYYKELYLAINEKHGIIMEEEKEKDFEYTADEETLAMGKESTNEKEYGETRLFYVIGIIVAIIIAIIILGIIIFFSMRSNDNKETIKQSEEMGINDTDNNKNTTQKEQGESAPEGGQFFNAKSRLLTTVMGTGLFMSGMYLMDKKAKVENCSNKENITNKQSDFNFGKTTTKDRANDSDPAIDETDVNVQTGYGESKEGKSQQR